jgi:hypothetical protein
MGRQTGELIKAQRPPCPIMAKQQLLRLRLAGRTSSQLGPEGRHERLLALPFQFSLGPIDHLRLE